MHIKLVQPKVEYVRKLRITCQRCGYEWLSETKAAKRTSCSRCKTSITLPPQNMNRNTDPLQIKSRAELEEILDPETSKLRKKISAMVTNDRETWMKAYHDFADRNPDMALDLIKGIIQTNEQEKGILKEAKARRMTKAQTYLFNLLKRRERFNALCNKYPERYPKDLIKVVSAEYDLLWEMGYDLYLLEKAESMDAAKNDKITLKNQNKSKMKKSVRRSRP